MTARVITAIVFTIIVLGSILLGGWAMIALLSFCMVISTYEMYKAFRNKGIESVCWTGYLFCGMTIIAECLTFYTSAARLNLMLIALLVSLIAAMTRLVSHGQIAVDSLLSTLFPMIYPGLFYIALMNMASMNNRALYAAAMVLTFFTASINDVFALFGGMLFGKHKLAPILSPKKTIEGSISGILFSTAFSMCIPFLLKLVLARDAAFQSTCESLPSIAGFALLGFLCGVMSQIGDLTASMVKRHCGIKDFGYLLPGHGGIMDRLDGVLFCSAACYIFFDVYKLLL